MLLDKKLFPFTGRPSVRNYDVLGVSKVQFESVLARHSSNLSQTGRYTFGGNVSAFSYVSKNNGHSIDFKLFEEQFYLNNHDILHRSTINSANLFLFL